MGTYRRDKGWLTPDKLRDINSRKKERGLAWDDKVVEDTIGMLQNKNIHYEAIIGYLEVQAKRQIEPGQHYNGMRSWLLELVYNALYLRHKNNKTQILERLQYYSGIEAIAKQNNPLWVFSLNHDMIIECIAAQHGIPVNCGFSNDLVSIPCQPNNHEQLEITGETIPRDMLEKGALNFLRFGQFGINMIKMHGSLDTFTFRDGHDMIRILPSDQSALNIIETIEHINDDLSYTFPHSQERVHATNEITYADKSGEMQFLRRSLLSGVFKYDKTGHQVMPLSYFDHFKHNINNVTELACIGYGFGDLHVNRVLKEWLEFSNLRRLIIVSPNASIPSTLLHLSPQITISTTTATNYLDELSGIVRDKSQTSKKRILEWLRAASHDDRKKLEAYVQEAFSANMKSIEQQLAKLPVRNNDIDSDGLGISQEELRNRIAREFPFSIEDIFEDFLKEHAVSR